MSSFIPLVDPLPILRGEENIEEWKLKVIQAFARVGLADYLFASANDAVATPAPEKLAHGIAILVPSLVQQRAYLTKAGWKFDARDQDPKALYQLVLRSVTQRALSVTVNDDLFKLLRIEMKPNESVDDYTHRVRGLRGCLQNAGYHVDEQLLVRVTLHGMMNHPNKKNWVNGIVRDDLAPGSLTFHKLEKFMLAAEAGQKKADGKKVESAKTVTHPGASQNGPSTSGAAQTGAAEARHVHFDNVPHNNGQRDNISPGRVGPDIVHPCLPRSNMARPNTTGSDDNSISTQRPGTTRVSNVGPDSVRLGNGPPSNIHPAEAPSLPTHLYQRNHPMSGAWPRELPADRIKDAMSIDNILDPRDPAIRQGPSGAQQLARPPTAAPATRATHSPYPGQAPPEARHYMPDVPNASNSRRAGFTPYWMRIPGAYTDAEEEGTSEEMEEVLERRLRASPFGALLGGAGEVR
jgi:hypothetical protein